MTRAQKWFLLIAIVLGCIAGPILVAQMQQSGGAGSTVTANIGTTNGLALDATLTGGNQKAKLVDSGGTNVATVSAAGALKVDGSAATQPVSGTFWQVTQPVSIASLPALAAGTSVIGKTVPITACGATVFSQALAAVPTSATAATATTTCVYAVVFNNTNASAQSVTVTDNQGSPITAINAFSIPANSNVTFPFYGTQFTSGIKWSAGGSGVTGSIVGVQ